MKGQSRDVDLKKSTSVRFPGALKALLGATARVAPGLAARRLANGFVTPMRAASPARELEWQRGAAHHTVRCGDYELAVRSRGLGGPQVLLVHGWSGRGSQLGAFVEPLVEQGFEVNWFDLPAHGASSGAQAGMPQAIAAVEAVVDWLGGADTVIAHSMGSAATTLAASRGAAIGRMVYLSPPDDVGSYLWVVGRLLGLPEGIIGRAQRELEARFQVRLRRPATEPRGAFDAAIAARLPRPGRPGGDPGRSGTGDRSLAARGAEAHGRPGAPPDPPGSAGDRSGGGAPHRPSDRAPARRLRPPQPSCSRIHSARRETASGSRSPGSSIRVLSQLFISLMRIWARAAFSSFKVV